MRPEILQIFSDIKNDLMSDPGELDNLLAAAEYNELVAGEENK